MTSISSHIPLSKDTQRKLIFAHRPLSGFVIAAIGFGGAYFLFTSHVIDDRTAHFFFSGFLALFGVFGAIAAFWRYRIEVDLLSRTYLAERGFWPNIKKWKGPLEEMRGIILTVAVVKQDRSTRTLWTVSLDLNGLKKPASIYVTTAERKAYEKMEHYAKKLRVMAIDKTGSEERRTTWGDLDKTIVEKLDEAPEKIVPPPPGSNIELIELYEDSLGTRIVLPSEGFSFGAVFWFLFGLPFASFGLFAGWTSLFHPEHVEGPLYVLFILALVFGGVGFLIILASCYSIWGREVIIGLQDRIIDRGLLFGKYIGIKSSLLKHEIEEVTIKPVPSRKSYLGKAVDRNELFIRSDRGVLHIGRGLSAEKLQWLKNAVLYLIER